MTVGMGATEVCEAAVEVMAGNISGSGIIILKEM